MGHTELLSHVPRLLDVRKVIQVLSVDLPTFRDQLEKFIWSRGREEREPGTGSGCARICLPDLCRD